MKRETENMEWLDEYNALKQVSRSNPFTMPEGYMSALEERICSFVGITNLVHNAPDGGFIVPENYFDTLTANIQSRIFVETFARGDGFEIPAQYFNDLSDKITGVVFIQEQAPAEHHGFKIPAQYFEELSNSIQSRINIVEVTGADAGLTVPNGYFENLISNITSRIAVENAAPVEAENFIVPEGYFEALGENIRSRINLDQLVGDNAVLFDVPEGYFNTLNKQILEKTTNQPKGLIREAVIRKLVTSNIFKYATAACFALAIGTGIIINQHNASSSAAHARSALHEALSDVSADDLQSYLQLHVDAADTHGLITDDKQINSDNLNNNLQDYLESNQ
jgi:hypothetical protein